MDLGDEPVAGIVEEPLDTTQGVSLADFVARGVVAHQRIGPISCRYTYLPLASVIASASNTTIIESGRQQVA